LQKNEVTVKNLIDSMKYFHETLTFRRKKRVVVLEHCVFLEEDKG